MLRLYNAHRHRSWFGGIAVVLAIVLTSAGGVRGQSADEALARQAFEVAENWVGRAEVPESTLPIRMDNVAAVHVTLRRNGLTLGRATATAEEADTDTDTDANGDAQEEDGREDAAGEADLMRMLGQAVTEALRQAAGRLDQPDELRETASELSLDLQLAHPPQLIEMEHLRELPSRLTVNLHGLAMRRGSRWAWMFPGDATAANTTLSGQLNRLLADLDLPLDQMDRVGRPDGPPLYRFEVIHLVRPRPDQAIERLHRGNVLMPAVSLDDESLGTLGRQLADHLLGRQRSDGRFAGTYEPTADRHQPPTADPFDAAQAVLALARVARLPNLDDERRDRAAEAARRGVEALARAVLDADDDDRSDPAARLGPAAMTLLAMLETPAAGDHDEARDRLISALEAMRQSDGLFHTGTRSNARLAPQSHQSLAAAAIVQIYERTRDPDWLEQSRQTLDALWDGMDGEHFAESLPWLVYAEAALIRLGHPTSHEEQLARQSSELWKQQITPWTDEREGLPRSPDTIGGFLIGHPLIDDPTSQSAPLLTAQAIVLRTEGLVEESDRPRWLFRCGLAGRFLAQLTMQPSSAYYTRSPSEAVGGMRMSFWNNRQPLDATASGLLAVTELQHTLARLAELQ